MGQVTTLNSSKHWKQLHVVDAILSLAVPIDDAFKLY